MVVASSVVSLASAVGMLVTSRQEVSMDMSRYDPAEVARFEARPGDHGAMMRFAVHVERRCPTHVWPHMVFARFAVEPEERAYHYAAAVRAGNAQLGAEQAGRASRDRDPAEARLFRMALRAHANQSAALGFPHDSARAVARLLDVSPREGAWALDTAQSMGVIPAQAAETAAGMRM